MAELYSVGTVASRQTLQDDLHRRFRSWQAGLMTHASGARMQWESALTTVASSLMGLNQRAQHFGAELPIPKRHTEPHPFLKGIASAAQTAVRRSPSSAGQSPSLLRDPELEKREHIKRQLSNVPVYTVVNAKSEFVLVSSEQGPGRQLGLVFFNQEDAQSLLKTMKASGAALAKKARVIPTNLSSVYSLVLTPHTVPGATSPVAFRFVPRPCEVEAALQLYHAAGVNAAGFVGVPVFQAEGLTVKSNGQTRTPLFLSKEDLNVAMGGAAADQHTHMVERTKKLVAQADEAVVRCQAELGMAGDDAKRRKKAQRALDDARALKRKHEAYVAKLERGEAKLPHVDLGSLEEVLQKMQTDGKGEWSDVMLIPPGTMANLAKKKK